MEESIRVRRYEQLPTAKDFESLIELQNVPAVFVRCTKDWRAFSKWNPSNAGLDYLQARVGSSAVEAMMSGSAPVFYGDLGSHERVPLPFSTFIDFCKQRMQSKHQESLGPSCLSPQTHDLSSSGIDGAYLSSECVPEQIYLAQVPIMNSDCEERVQLETLRKDIQIPSFLEEKELSSINLWMNNAQARSSTHYDPHHNILCIVCGRKQVVLWPPSSSPSLYPMPIYGEASNHSSVALENPDYSIYPRAEHSIDFAQKVILEAGDALFIPEGWFHQVDSDDLTIAINFWWRSNIMSSMLEHMDAYYLRRILRRLIDKEMDQLLLKLGKGKTRTCGYKLPNNGQADHGDDNHNQMFKEMDLKEKKLQEGNTLLELEPAAAQVLHDLVSLVHNCVGANQDQQSFSASVNDVEVRENGKCEKRVDGSLKDDPIAKILWDVEPHSLQHVFLAMAHNFPRTLEAFVLHALSPVGAEVLTRKFDEMDQQSLEEDRIRFYEVFYSAFDDQSAAMNSILKGKESFTQQAFKSVLDKFVGVNLESSKLGVRRDA
ncbi:PREDICTED: jmjC domain-containing protein C isoform X1 [Lupinus angustifolius]|uniref:jmjC domain-containing protein C isoform X1 n=1 Tax=Lupinus angustifolius TaxID=3871 RepID=UPI00092E5465|nr:PREDICTED: jmjC domain-containing protein C isoform X1 [Lupinus angustifolius]